MPPSISRGSRGEGLEQCIADEWTLSPALLRQSLPNKPRTAFSDQLGTFLQSQPINFLAEQLELASSMLPAVLKSFGVVVCTAPLLIPLLDFRNPSLMLLRLWVGRGPT